MNFASVIIDQKIKAKNVLVELTIGEYLDVAVDILNKNEFQRKRVIASSISKNLRSDLLVGCTIPPIVLAVTSGDDITPVELTKIKHEESVTKAFKEKSLVIIDGLQRTHVMKDLRDELLKNEDPRLHDYLNHIIRAEIYVGIEKLGILYRMLTLNTGQTTMSTRHLMEILYLDYMDNNFSGIELQRDIKDERLDQTTSQFRFKDAVDGFISYIEKNEIPIARAEILDNINNIKSLSTEGFEKDLFKEFILLFKNLLDKLITISGNPQFDSSDFTSELKLNSQPFGKNIVRIFKRSQALTGFGAALGHLKLINDLTFTEVESMVNEITTDDSFELDAKLVVKHLDLIRDNSKKVGNDQRFYFRNLFRSLFDKKGDFPHNLTKAIEYAYKRVKTDKLNDMEDEY